MALLFVPIIIRLFGSVNYTVSKFCRIFKKGMQKPFAPLLLLFFLFLLRRLLFSDRLDCVRPAADMEFFLLRGTLPRWISRQRGFRGTVAVQLDRHAPQIQAGVNQLAYQHQDNRPDWHTEEHPQKAVKPAKQHNGKDHPEGGKPG